MSRPAAAPGGAAERTECVVFEGDAATAARLSDLLFEQFGEMGAIVSAVETPSGGWRIECLLPAGSRWHDLASGFAASAAAHGLGRRAASKVAVVDPAALRAPPAPELEPVRAGRFLVHDSAHSPAGGGIGIEIDAGLAFGTGHHATTEGCLRALDAALKARRFVRPLDLGCGSGLLAIAAAKVLRVPVTASDNDPVAVAVARANTRRNTVAPLVRSLCAEGLDHPALRPPARFDLIMANILAGPLTALAGGIARAATPGARVILSGLLASQCARIEARYRAAGFVLADRLLIKEWATLTLHLPGPPKGGERNPRTDQT